MTALTVSSTRLVMALGLLVVLCLSSAQARAVSLGDEVILSLLGDPVEVEVELQQWQELDLDRVQVSVGTESDYRNFGLVWQSVLSSIRLNLVGPNLDGKVRVLISSRDPLNEPYLELLVVVRWPGGSLLREYILLFDPPPSQISPAQVTYLEPPPISVTAEDVAGNQEPEEQRLAPQPDSQSPVIPVDLAQALPLVPPVTSRPPAASSIAAEQDQTPALPGAAPESLPRATSDVPDFTNTFAVEVETLRPRQTLRPGQGQTGRRTVQVTTNDSLWSIARQEVPRGDEADWFQYMLALFELNRTAFVNDNIALLKSGETLQLPAGPDLAKFDSKAARSRFEQRWQADTQGFFVVEAPEPLVSEPPGTVLADADADAVAVDLAGTEPAPAEPPLLMPEPNTMIVTMAPEQAQANNPGLNPGPQRSAPSPASELPLPELITPQAEPIFIVPPESELPLPEPQVLAEEPLQQAPVAQTQPVEQEPVEVELGAEEQELVETDSMPTPAELAGPGAPDQGAASPTAENVPDESPLFVSERPAVTISTIIQTKQQRLSELEEMVVVMRGHQQDAEAIAAELKAALALKLAERGRWGGGLWLNLLAGVMLLGLIAATAMLLRISGQLKSQTLVTDNPPHLALIRKRRRKKTI